VPFLVLAVFSVLLVVAPAWALAAAVLYAALTGLEAARVGRGLSPSGIATVWALCPVLQVSQGVGFAVGLLRYGLRPDW
jgi:hypothetical protein